MAIINGTSENDVLVGISENDEIWGFEGSDTLVAAGGSDTLRGNKGADLINISQDGGDHLALGGADADTIIFGKGRDTAFGGSGNDAFLWGDFFTEFDGDLDEVDGQDGNDLLSADFSFQSALESITVTGDANGTRNLITRQDGSDTTIVQFTSFEFLELEVPDGVNLNGLVGSIDSDNIQVGSGTHTADTGGGADLFGISLDTNADTIALGDGTDQLNITYGSITTDLVFDLKTGVVTSNGATLLSYSGVELFNIQGSGTSNDVFNGTAGNDTINGAGGSDTVEGRLGDDVITLTATATTTSTANGGLDTDTLIIEGGTEITGARMDMNGTIVDSVFVNVAGTQTITAIGIEQISVVGTAGDDFLFGLAGNDTIEGGKGNDILIGRGGSDTIITNGGLDGVKGGGGADTFVFGEGSFGAGQSMTVVDFNQGQDILALDKSAFDVTFAVGGAIDFISGTDIGKTSSTGTGSQFMFDTDTGRLFLDQDGAGGEDADLLGRIFINDVVIVQVTADDIEII